MDYTLAMINHDGIELGVAGGKTPNETLNASLERLLSLLRDVIAVTDLAGDGTLQDRIEQCRIVLAEGSRKRLEFVEHQGAIASFIGQEDIVSLGGIVREALAIVANDGQTFNNISHSMERFEALVQINDTGELKKQLMKEINELRNLAADRQYAWQETCDEFADRVDTLERQLTATKQEAALDPLTRIANRGTFDRACREWLKLRHGQFVLAMLDIDNFKSINDTHGHGVGDRATVAVAQALKISCALPKISSPGWAATSLPCSSPT